MSRKHTRVTEASDFVVIEAETEFSQTHKQTQSEKNRSKVRAEEIAYIIIYIICLILNWKNSQILLWEVHTKTQPTKLRRLGIRSQSFAGCCLRGTLQLFHEVKNICIVSAALLLHGIDLRRNGDKHRKKVGELSKTLLRTKNYRKRDSREFKAPGFRID